MAAAGCTAEQVGMTLAILAATKSAQLRRERNKRYYQARVLKRLSETSEKRLTASEKRLKTSYSRAGAGAGVLCLEESSISKELPTVARKSVLNTDLFGSPDTTALKRSRREVERTTIDFVGELWNATAAMFPRMATIAVVPDGSTRERAILARTKTLEIDWGLDMQAGWQAFFGKIRASPFLRGEAPPGPGRDRSFKPTLDAMLALTMFTKIMENHYAPEIQYKPPGNGRYAAAYGR